MLAVVSLNRTIKSVLLICMALLASGCRDSNASGVNTVNGLTGDITLQAGSDVTLQQNANTITISASSAIAGPAGPQGAPGPTGATGPGLEAGLTRIFNLSWQHGATSNLTVTLDGGPVFGFVVAFGRDSLGDTGVIFNSSSVSSDTFEIYTEELVNATFKTYRKLRIEPEAVVPVQVVATTGNVITEVQTVTGPIAPAALVTINTDVVGYLIGSNAKVIITLKGDLVIDENGRAVDAEFLRAELPTGDRESGGLYGVQGGLFESWFLAN